MSSVSNCGEGSALAKRLELADPDNSKGWSYGKIAGATFAGVTLVASLVFMAYCYRGMSSQVLPKNDTNPKTEFCVYEKEQLSSILESLQFKDGKEQREFYNAITGTISDAARKAVDTRGEDPVQVALASCENRKNLKEVIRDKGGFWESSAAVAYEKYTEFRERGFSALGWKGIGGGVFPIIKTRSCQERLVAKYHNDPKVMIDASGRTNKEVNQLIGISRSQEKVNQFIRDYKLDWNCNR